MANKDTFEAFISIVQDKIMDFTDGSSKPNFEVVKDEAREKFDELIRSQGYVSKEEFEALEAIAKRLESRLDELEAKTK